MSSVFTKILLETQTTIYSHQVYYYYNSILFLFICNSRSDDTLQYTDNYRLQEEMHVGGNTKFTHFGNNCCNNAMSYRTVQLF